MLEPASRLRPAAPGMMFALNPDLGGYPTNNSRAAGIFMCLIAVLMNDESAITVRSWGKDVTLNPAMGII